MELMAWPLSGECQSSVFFFVPLLRLLSGVEFTFENRAETDHKHNECIPTERFLQVSGNVVLHSEIKRPLPDFASEKSSAVLIHRSIVITIIVIAIVISGSSSLFPALLFLLILLFPLKCRSLPDNLGLASNRYLQEQTQDAVRKRRKGCASARKVEKSKRIQAKSI